MSKIIPDKEYLVLISYLPLRRFWAILKFLRLSRAIQAQLSESKGLIGYSLEAHILSRNFWTLSVWEDQKSLTEFVLKAPHHDAMGTLKQDMGNTKFVRWKAMGSELPPSWVNALNRLQSEHEGRVGIS